MKNATYIFELNDLQKLRDDMHRALDFRFDEFQKKVQLIEILPSNNRIEWKEGELSLSVFHELLTELGFIINCDWNCFKIHFIGNEAVVNKIQFYGQINELAYLMDCLQDEGFISISKHTHVRLAQHFFNRFGEPIDNNVLRASLNKSLSDKRKEFIDRKIIDILLKRFY